MAGTINIKVAAFAPYLVKAGKMRPSDLAGFDLAVPDTWYSRSAEISTVQSSSSATGITLTAANMLNQLFLRSGANAGQSDTTPTAAQLVAAIPGIAVNRGIYWQYRNASTQTVTLAAADSSVTLASGNTNTIAANACRTFLIVFTNVTPGSEAVTIYSLGASSF